jgi:ring-1,2-phenylacetyl-CoA epoxidase subunit PaaE
MTEIVRDVLQEHGLPKEKTYFELFATSLSTAGEKRRAAASTQKEDTEVSEIKIMIDGRTIEYHLPRNTHNILDAGNEHGADLPFSCKAGVCSTCKAKVMEGEVEMDANYALEDYEIDAGYVLSCQCYPITEKVVLSFDEV